MLESSLHYLIDNEIDLSTFDLQYRNDETGDPVHDPVTLLYNHCCHGYGRFWLGRTAIWGPGSEAD